MSTLVNLGGQMTAMQRLPTAMKGRFRVVQFIDWRTH